VPFLPERNRDLGDPLPLRFCDFCEVPTGDSTLG